MVSFYFNTFFHCLTNNLMHLYHKPFAGFSFFHLEISLHRGAERNECHGPFQMISKLSTVNSSVIWLMSPGDQSLTRDLSKPNNFYIEYMVTSGNVLLLLRSARESDEEWCFFIFWILHWFKRKTWHQESIWSSSEVCLRLSFSWEMQSCSLCTSLHVLPSRVMKSKSSAA